MLLQTFDPTKKYRAVIYARMSHHSQNPRSPDQQIAVIRDLLKRLNLPWKVVATYRDDAKSARYKRIRREYQKLLRDLKTKSLRAHILLIDTFERLCRSEDSAEVRRQFERLGVLVLTADSQFHDPTSVPGKALAVIESIRATEDGRIKAHNVLRGKKDAILLGHWPGGPVPFGFKLQNVMISRNGVDEIDYRILVPAEEVRWIVELIFTLAADRGWGGTRLCKHLNDHPEVPANMKPFLNTTIASMLRNEIYYGEMVWRKNCTGVVDDIRVLRPLEEHDWFRNETFCDGIIAKELWTRANEPGAARRLKRSEQGDEPDEVGAFHRRSGVALKYPLSGLVVCSHCGRSMVASSSAAYTTVAGEQRRYVSYVCPGSYSDACTNDRHIPEAWLREVVFNLVRERLLPRLCG